MTRVCFRMALRQTRNQLGERQVPVLGVLAAFIFAAQAINFPVAGGTSGHLLGEEGRLDAVEEALEPTHQLRLGNPQLHVGGDSFGEREGQAIQLITEVG